MTAQPDDRPESIWRARPVLSGLLRTGIVAIPIASALGTDLDRSTPCIPSPFGPWWVLLLAPGVLVAIAVERLARRLVPLAMLLKLSMLFPDRAPSRFRGRPAKPGHLRHLESLPGPRR